MEVFTADNLVIVTSRFDFEAFEWRDYMARNWKRLRLVRKRSSLLVLAGSHGREDGALGRVDPGLLEDFAEQIERLKVEMASEMSNNEVTMELLDIGDFADKDDVLDEARLVRAVSERNPTVLVLGICYPRKSVLNKILRAAGIYAFLVLNEDRARITEGRCLTMDPWQREVVETFVRETPQNLFLWGSSGTGKTLVLSQALAIKIDYYGHRLRRQVDVIVAVFTVGCNLLLAEWRTKHLQHLDSTGNIRFMSMEDIRDEFGIQPGYPQICPHRALNELIDTLEKRQGDRHTILVVDEVFPQTPRDLGTDWSGMAADKKNVDVMVALHPHGFDVHSPFRVVPPPCTPRTLSRQLKTRHRNCLHVRLLNDFHLRHYNPGTLSIEDDEDVGEQMLPRGHLPVWIVRSQDVGDVEVLEKVKEDHVEDGNSVTVVRTDGDPPSRDVSDWCQCQVWHGRQTWKCRTRNDMVGCEDEAVVVMGGVNDPIQEREQMLRARNRLVIVTSRKKLDLPIPSLDLDHLLEDALDHADKNYKCFLLEDCRFVGQTLLVRQLLGDQRPWQSKGRRLDCLRQLIEDLGFHDVTDDFVDKLDSTWEVADRVSAYLTARRRKDDAGADAAHCLAWLTGMVAKACQYLKAMQGKARERGEPGVPLDDLDLVTLLGLSDAATASQVLQEEKTDGNSSITT